MACNNCSNNGDHRENLIQRIRGRISHNELMEQNHRARLAAVERAASVHPVFWPISGESAFTLLANGVKIIGKSDRATWPVIVHGAISSLGLFRDLGGSQELDTALDFRLQINDTGITERTWASEPVPEPLFTGQARRWEGGSATIVDHFEIVRYPVPVLVESGNRLVLTMQNDGANTGYTNGIFNFLGMHVYEYSANQGKLTDDTRKRVTEYIRAYDQQRFIIITLDVDFTQDTKSLQFNTYYDDLLVLGFASDLWHSTIEITDPYDVRWTSNPTLIQALCSYSPSFPEISRFRKLVEPQFLPRATSYTCNVQKLTDIGTVTETGSKIYMLAKTV